MNEKAGVQESNGFGPLLCVLIISDLNTMTDTFADDTVILSCFLELNPWNCIHVQNIQYALSVPVLMQTPVLVILVKVHQGAFFCFSMSPVCRRF